MPLNANFFFRVPLLKAFRQFWGWRVLFFCFELVGRHIFDFEIALFFFLEHTATQLLGLKSCSLRKSSWERFGKSMNGTKL